MKSGYNVLCASRGIDVSGGCINVMEEAADPELESLLFDPCLLFKVVWADRMSGSKLHEIVRVGWDRHIG